MNYDCDLEGANLFERMVTALVRIAQTSASPDAPVPQQEEERALRVLVRHPNISRPDSRPVFSGRFWNMSVATLCRECRHVSSWHVQALGCNILQALQCCVNILRSLVEWYTKTQQAASLAAAALAAAAAPGIDIVGDDAASDSTAAGAAPVLC